MQAPTVAYLKLGTTLAAPQIVRVRIPAAIFARADIRLIDNHDKTTPRVEYYLMHSGANVGRVTDGWDGAYLDQTGQWISHPSVFRHVTGIGGDADAEPITLEQAQQWVAKNRPGVAVEWL